MRWNKLEHFLDNATQASRLGWLRQLTCEESVVLKKTHVVLFMKKREKEIILPKVFDNIKIIGLMTADLSLL
jgi:hypothetical protein